MNIQQAFKGEIRLAFEYKKSNNSKPVRYEIEPERIRYVMIEKLYENVNVLPVIYISLTLKNEMYQKVIDSYETSQFYLRIRKHNVMSNTSIMTEVVQDTFSYVSSSTGTDYARELASSSTVDESFKGILIGLVSLTATNQLKVNFNDIFYNVDQETLVRDYALKGIKNLIMQPLDYNKKFKNILIPPVPTRYRLLRNLFDRKPFYDSMFTFFMDFRNTYLVSKNGVGTDAKDGKPNTIMINVKDFTAEDAYTDGFTIKNNAYIVNINAIDTNPVINDATSKATTNIVSYSDNNGVQNLNLEDSNNTITTYLRSDNAAAIKNEISSTKYMIELKKQNIDCEIFTPNKEIIVSNFGELAKYDGKYILSYKKEFYYYTQGGEFTITCNIGLKLTQEEESAMSRSDNVVPKTRTKGSKIKKSSARKPNNTVKATREANTENSSKTSVATRK